MTFINEKSHYAVLHFAKSKDQSLVTFKHYVAFAERDTGEKLKKIRMDNVGEYTSAAWDNYCKQTGGSHSKGPPHSPQLNGKAERFNRTILDKILPSLFHAGLPVHFWGAGAQHAVSSYNLTRTRVNEGKSSPHTLWKLLPASYHHD